MNRSLIHGWETSNPNRQFSPKHTTQKTVKVTISVVLPYSLEASATTARLGRTQPTRAKSEQQYCG
jgi:hypothetical protein